ncbi:hypothetical protein [Schleiferilactobacillus shenzhenensis]|uniref:hypothetical protein n=1 Tax=Schleiferilactobacillus shenzhenensis TaxID=1231337 RepID=UPI0012DF692E|nr:hypothetical protein [Schleiferilactobacillus shenzhenensis]
MDASNLDVIYQLQEIVWFASNISVVSFTTDNKNNVLYQVYPLQRLKQKALMLTLAKKCWKNIKNTIAIGSNRAYSKDAHV